MRRTLLSIAALAVVAAWAPEGRAQSGAGVFDDPFFTYYGYFLPRQAALAAEPRIQDTINQNFANNQVYASTNRGGLYDPNGGYGAFDNYDPNAAYDKPMKRGAGVSAGAGPRRAVRGMPSNISGRGPQLYYNRAAQYYPGLRSGVGPNRNLAVTGRGVRGGGMGGMSGMGGMGPR